MLPALRGKYISEKLTRNEKRKTWKNRKVWSNKITAWISSFFYYCAHLWVHSTMLAIIKAILIFGRHFGVHSILCGSQHRSVKAGSMHFISRVFSHWVELSRSLDGETPRLMTGNNVKCRTISDSHSQLLFGFTSNRNVDRNHDCQRPKVFPLGGFATSHN